MKQDNLTILRGLDALQAALSDPSVAVFRVRWTGRVEPVTRAEACALAVRGDGRSLMAELR